MNTTAPEGPTNRTTHPSQTPPGSWVIGAPVPGAEAPGYLRAPCERTKPRPRLLRFVSPLALASSLALAQPTVTFPAGTQPGGGDASTSPNTQPLTVEVVPETPPPEPIRDHDADAIAVLDAAEQAIADLQAFRTTLTMTPLGLLKGMNAEGSAEIIARRAPDDPERWQLRFTGPIVPDRAKEPIDIDASFDGNRMRYVDHENRVVGARVVPVRVNQPYFSVPAQLWEQELWTRPDVFAEIRGAERLTLEPRQTIDGVECDVVKGVLTGGQISHTIFVAVDDRLPRRTVERFEVKLTPDGPPMTGEYTFTYASLTIDPDLADADFELPVPEGYQDQPFPQVNTVGNGEPTNIVPKPPSEGGADGSTPDGDSAMAAEADAAGVEGATTAMNAEQMSALMNQVAASATGRTIPLPPGNTASTTANHDTSFIPTVPGDTEIAAEFEIKDATGQIIRLADFRGSPVVLVFWGSWNRWAGDLVTAVQPVVQEAAGARLLVLAIRERSDQTSAQRFRTLNSTGTLLPAADEVAALYEVGAIPTIVVIDAEGRITFRHAGFNAEASPIPDLRAALGLAEP